MDVVLTQHPVGQGGMMSGRLTVPGGRFLWIYDCGSNQTAALDREIDAIAHEGHVDGLFLSHLDSDHVNGVEHLLSSMPVREVVLPYLDTIDRLVAAAHDIASGTSTNAFLAFLSNPAGWLGDRGVQRVTYIRPRSEDEGSDGPPLREGDGGGEGELRVDWSHPAQEPPKDAPHHDPSHPGPAVRYLPSDANLQMWAASRPLDWLLVPYTHRPPGETLDAFEQALTEAFDGRHRDPGFLAVLLRDEQTRKRIRDCYDRIHSDHNLVSMALYSGPLRCDRWSNDAIWSMGGYQWESRTNHSRPIGWLGTGDMHLDVARRRKAFLDHYRALLDQVNVFALPHHGSDRNFDPALPAALPNASQFVAAAGPNRYDHPGKIATQTIEATGKAFVRVSDRPDSGLAWRHRFP